MLVELEVGNSSDSNPSCFPQATLHVEIIFYFSPSFLSRQWHCLVCGWYHSLQAWRCFSGECSLSGCSSLSSPSLSCTRPPEREFKPTLPGKKLPHPGAVCTKARWGCATVCSWLYSSSLFCLACKHVWLARGHVSKTNTHKSLNCQCYDSWGWLV